MTTNSVTPENRPKPPVQQARRSGGHGNGSQAMRQDVFSVSEGDVILSWPTPLSAESIEEVKDWLKIAERKIVRSEKIKDDPPPDQTNDENDDQSS